MHEALDPCVRPLCLLSEMCAANSCNVQTYICPTYVCTCDHGDCIQKIKRKGLGPLHEALDPCVRPWTPA